MLFLCLALFRCYSFQESIFPTRVYAFWGCNLCICHPSAHVKSTVSAWWYKEKQCSSTNNNSRVAITLKCSKTGSLAWTLANSDTYFLNYYLLKMESTNPPQLSNSLKRPKLWRRRSTLHVKKDHRERGKVSTGTSKHSSEVKALHSTMFRKVV